MFTTPTAEADHTGTRAESLDRWLKQTQEALAHRRRQGQPLTHLFNLLRTKRLMEVALDRVLQNTGARTPGVDGITGNNLQTKDGHMRQTFLDELWGDICTKTYQPSPVRRVYIPKPNGDRRPLGIPTIRDRVVQEMLRLILEPIYEPTFYAHSYGFRPFRAPHHAVVRLKDLIGRRGYTVAIEGDIRKCFDRIQHTHLLRILRRTIKDERIIKLVKQMLAAGVMEDGGWHLTEDGTPQGGICSPLLANIYLNELDQFIAAKWADLSKPERQRRRAQQTACPCYITRYADDFVVLVQGTMETAMQLKAEIATFLRQELQLELSAEKTLVTPVTTGFDFLGFHIRKYGDGVTLITPSRKAIATFKAQVKDRVARAFRESDTAGIVTLNRYLRGWGAYYRRVSSSAEFKSLDQYVWWRVMRTTYRLRGTGQGASFAQFCRDHSIPYRCDLHQKNRHREGGHYGVWADIAHEHAYIITKLTFLRIEYINLHSQLNPYIPFDRYRLEQLAARQQWTTRPERNQPMINKAYGLAWEEARQAKLIAAEYRCERCGQAIKGQTAAVHHQIPLKQARTQAEGNMLENLICLCPGCHGQAEQAWRKAQR